MEGRLGQSMDSCIRRFRFDHVFYVIATSSHCTACDRVVALEFFRNQCIPGQLGDAARLESAVSGSQRGMAISCVLRSVTVVHVHGLPFAESHPGF